MNYKTLNIPKVLNKLTYNKIIHDRIFRPYNYLGKDNDIELVCAWNQLPNQELSLSYLKDVKSKRIGKTWTKVKWLRKHWEVPCFGHSHTDTHKRPVRNLTSHFSATKKVTEKVTIRLSDELWLVEGWWWDTPPFLVAFFYFLVTQDFSKLNTLYRICLTCYMCIFRPKIIVYCMWRRITTSFFFSICGSLWRYRRFSSWRCLFYLSARTVLSLYVTVIQKVLSRITLSIDEYNFIVEHDPFLDSQESVIFHIFTLFLMW